MFSNSLLQKAQFVWGSVIDQLMSSFLTGIEFFTNFQIKLLLCKGFYVSKGIANGIQQNSGLHPASISFVFVSINKHVPLCILLFSNLAKSIDLLHVWLNEHFAECPRLCFYHRVGLTFLHSICLFPFGVDQWAWFSKMFYPLPTCQTSSMTEFPSYWGWFSMIHPHEADDCTLELNSGELLDT